jgi:hypothetical protein
MSNERTPSTHASTLIYVLAGMTKPIAMAPIDFLKTNLQLGNPVGPMIKKDGLVRSLYRGVGALSMQFGVYYGGVLSFKTVVGDDCKGAKLAGVTIAQTLYGMGIMMHTEHLKINQQAGAQGGNPLKLIAKEYGAGNGSKFRRGTPFLFLRELLFMIPINVRGMAEKFSEDQIEKAGFTSPTVKKYSKWPGTFGIFFVSGYFTNIPDALNSNVKKDGTEVFKAGEYVSQEIKKRGMVGFLKRYNTGAPMRGLAIAVSATATFVCVDMYKYLYHQQSFIE